PRVVQCLEAQRELPQSHAEPALVVERRVVTTVAAVARRPVYPLEEVDTLHELHREEPVVILAIQLAEANQVAMLEIRARAELGLQVEDGLRIDPAQSLERDRHLAIAIERFVDNSHA